MGMLAALVDLQFAEQLTAQCVVRKHPFDSFLNDALGKTLLEVLEGLHLHAARTTGVTAVELLLRLVSADADLVSVHHDDEIAGVEVGRIGGLVLATQYGSHLCGQAAQGLILSVHQIPLAFDRID